MDRMMRQNENMIYSDRLYQPQPQPIISAPVNYQQVPVRNYAQPVPVSNYAQMNHPQQPPRRQLQEPLIQDKKDEELCINK